MGPYLIADGDQTLVIEDSVNPACNTSIVAVAPASCSPTCVIDFAALTVFCNDNGTVSLQSDDFYEITIDATVANGGPTNNFVVLVNGLPAGTFAHGSGGTIILPADGSTPTIAIQDETETGCTVAQALPPLVPCTPPCMISATVNNILCNDNGTGNDATDDTYTFELLVNGQNISSAWELDNGTLSGNYGEVILMGPFSIVAGDQVLTVRDLVNPDCNFEVTATAPAPCSSCLQTVDAGSGFTLTCKDTVALLSATSSEPGTYQWTGPSGFVSSELTAMVSQPEPIISLPFIPIIA